MHRYDHDLDPTTACAACPAGKRTHATGSGDCFMEQCPPRPSGLQSALEPSAAEGLHIVYCLWIAWAVRK